MTSSLKELDEREIARNAYHTAAEQLESLCAAHAGTFVQVERRARHLQDSLDALVKDLGEGRQQAETAQDALEREDELGHLTEQHRIRRRTLLQHSSLLELLELPNLMDACVRQGMYDDALAIAALEFSLPRRHNKLPPALEAVVSQLRDRRVDFRRHLLRQWQQDAPLTTCLEIMTALRQLDGLDGTRQLDQAAVTQWQVDFLEARNVWLDAGADADLLALLERHRTRVFEVVTQFHALFALESSDVLALWVTRRIHRVLQLLQATNWNDAAALRDAWEASLFFASSMGRLGADFSPQLWPIFETKMHHLVVTVWTQQGVEPLSEALSVCRQAGVATPLVHAGVVEEDDTLSSDFSGPQAPPKWLLQYPPLARLVNAILTGLNELRRCLLPGIVSPLRQSLLDVLQEILGLLQENDRLVHAPGQGNAALRQAAVLYRERWTESIEPYLRGSLEAAVGNVEGAVHYYGVFQENVRKNQEAAAVLEEKCADESLAAEESPLDASESSVPDP